MEAVSLHGYSLDQQISTQKSLIKSSKNPNNVNNPFVSSRQYVNHMLPPPSQYFHNMGILQPPHHNNILSRSSYPPPNSVQLPPLLPLPTTAHRHSSATAAIDRGLSFPPTTHKRPTKTKKKSKSPAMKDHVKSTIKVISPSVSSSQTNTTTSACGNKSQNMGSCVKVDRDRDVGCDDIMFSASVAFAISPPPSSLPLPTFSLRPKLNCKADARGVDNGATDDLRKILRLH